MAKRSGDKRNRRESFGYNYKFVDVPPSDIVCSICKLVAREPRQMECCGKVFCKECIERTWNSSKICPCCHQSGNCFIDHRGERQIKSLKVVCSNEKNGCKWVGTLEELDAHCSYCEFALVVCPNLGCSKMFVKENLEKHMEKECIFKRHRCPYCRKFGSYDEIKAKHPEECPLMKVPCPNGCDDASIIRCNVDAHRSTCPKENIDCHYSKVGCTTRLLRDSLPRHLEQDVKHHLELAVESNAKLTEELRVANEKVRDLETKPPPVSFKLSGFSSLRVSGGVWQSPAFYTYRGGYKMCIRVHANGFGTGNGTHISVSVHLMSGLYDDHLVWPFRGEVTVHLMNQISDEHHHWCLLAFRDEKVQGYNNRANANSVNKQGLGIDKFISHSNLKLKIDRLYLLDDNLYFHISKIVIYPLLKPWLIRDTVLSPVETPLLKDLLSQ